MKLLKVYLPAFISLCLILLLALIFLNETKKKKDVNENIDTPTNYNFKIITEELANCDEKTVYNDYISTYCLKSIKVEKNDITKDLKDYLEELKISDITEVMTKKIDPLTEDIIYTSDDHNLVNNSLKIISCQNGSYIISNNNLEYNSNLCK